MTYDQPQNSVSLMEISELSGEDIDGVSEMLKRFNEVSVVFDRYGTKALANKMLQDCINKGYFSCRQRPKKPFTTAFIKFICDEYAVEENDPRVRSLLKKIDGEAIFKDIKPNKQQYTDLPLDKQKFIKKLRQQNRELPNLSRHREALKGNYFIISRHNYLDDSFFLLEPFELKNELEMSNFSAFEDGVYEGYVEMWPDYAQVHLKAKDFQQNYRKFTLTIKFNNSSSGIFEAFFQRTIYLEPSLKVLKVYLIRSNAELNGNSNARSDVYHNFVAGNPNRVSKKSINPAKMRKSLMV